MNRILLVDDEQNVLNALRRELRDEYEVEAFTSPLAALQRCHETGFDLVISDYQMPEMKGIQFLGKFGEIQPDAVRMVLSGQADIEGLLGAINETHIFRFIAKPWDEAELKAGIAQALSYRTMILENRRQANTGRDSHPEKKHIEEQKTYRILLVDNDEAALGLMAHALSTGDNGVLDAMRHEFGQHEETLPQGSKWVVDTFVSATNALEQARHQPYDLVITAHSPPRLDGIHLLTEFHKCFSAASCILISAEPDMKTLDQAINDIHVDGFLNISWVSYELKADVMRRAWNLYQLRTAVMQALVAGEIRRKTSLLAAMSNSSFKK